MNIVLLAVVATAARCCFVSKAGTELVSGDAISNNNCSGTVYLQQVPLLSLARYNDAMHLPTQVGGRWLRETKKRIAGKYGVSPPQIGLLDCAQCVCPGQK